MSISIDPLGNPDVQRALAFARARERYPAADRETLLECCTAAWDAALEAESFGEDLTERFEGTLGLLAWTHGWTRRPVDLHSLQNRSIPYAALRPFMAEGDAKSRLDKLADAELAPARPPATRRPRPRLPRIPLVSPVPVGAAMAAGIVAVAGLNQAGAISLGPLDRSGGDGPSDDGARSQAKADDAPAAPLAGGSNGGDAVSSAAAGGAAPAAEGGDDATLAAAVTGPSPDAGIPAAVSSLSGPPTSAATTAPAPAGPAPVATPVAASGGAPASPAPAARRPVSLPAPAAIGLEADEEAIELVADPAPEHVPPGHADDEAPGDEPEPAIPEATVDLPGEFDVQLPPVVGAPGAGRRADTARPGRGGSRPARRRPGAAGPRPVSRVAINSPPGRAPKRRRAAPRPRSPRSRPAPRLPLPRLRPRRPRHPRRPRRHPHRPRPRLRRRPRRPEAPSGATNPAPAPPAPPAA